MGAGPFYGRGRSCSVYEKPTPPAPRVSTAPNPDPTNYKVKRYLEVGGNLVIEINYPDCTNFEGNKILVYRDCTYAELLVWNKKGIDPHFHDAASGKLAKSPFARFVPTSEGWKAAVFLASS